MPIVPKREAPGLSEDPGAVFARSYHRALRGRIYIISEVWLGGSDLSSVRDRTNVIFLHHSAPSLLSQAVKDRRRSRSGAPVVGGARDWGAYVAHQGGSWGAGECATILC